MKILFFASYPDLGIGYSRIANIITNYLASNGHIIYYVGISNFNQNKCDRFIHPNIILIDALQEEKIKGSNELYGVNVICDNIIKYNPDIVFIYNDIIVISRIFNNFIKYNIQKKFKLYIYLDLVYKFEKIELIEHVNKFSDIIFVFSECWKQNLMDIGIDENKIDILYHGIDNKLFFPIEKELARQHFNFNSDDFVILNTNRNNYRKCIDKTIDSFIKFLKIKNVDPKIKLFLNMNLNENINQSGYDILNLIKTNCIKYKLDYNKIIQNNIYKYNGDSVMSDEMLNYLYNACDIGINTCVGEGFGLCNLEHGSLGKPQIISNVGGLSDIFTNEYSILINPVTEIYVPNNIDFHGGYLEICSSDDFTNAMIKYYDNPTLLKNHGDICKKILCDKYNWDIILKSFVDKYFFSEKKNTIISVLGKKNDPGFYSNLFCTLNHYIYAKKNNLNFKLDSDNWLFKFKKGWLDYFEPINIDNIKSLLDQTIDIRYYGHLDIIENYPIYEYKNIISEVYRYNENTKNKIIETKKKLNLHNETYDSIFIRRGDKLYNESIYIETEKYINFLLIKNPDCKKIFLQTDDYNSYLDLQNYILKNNLDIEIITLCKPEQKGIVVNKKYVELLNNIMHNNNNHPNLDYIKKIITDIKNTKSVDKMDNIEIYDHVITMIIGIDIVADSNICITDYQSNATRFVKLFHKNINNVFDIYENKDIDFNKNICPVYSF